MREFLHRNNIELNLLALAVHRQGVEGATGAETRVVDEAGDGPAAQFLDQRLALRGVREIAWAHRHPDTVRGAQFVGQRVEAVLATGDQKQAVAAGGQHAGQFGSDSGRGASDDDLGGA